MISPNNSLLMDMNGGVDYIYTKLFPDILNKIRDVVKDLHPGRSENPYLLVGEAVTVRTDTTNLIVAPTMLLPIKVSETRNAYWAMRAILSEIYFHRPKITKIILCGLCTGIGKNESSGVR